MVKRIDQKTIINAAGNKVNLYTNENGQRVAEEYSKDGKPLKRSLFSPKDEDVATVIPRKSTIIEDLGNLLGGKTPGDFDYAQNEIYINHSKIDSGTFNAVTQERVKHHSDIQVLLFDERTNQETDLFYDGGKLVSRTEKEFKSL